MFNLLPETTVTEIENMFQELLHREDIAVILISQYVRRSNVFARIKRIRNMVVFPILHFANANITISLLNASSSYHFVTLHRLLI